MNIGQWKGASIMIRPNRGEIWFADLATDINQKDNERSQVLIISDNALNQGASKLLMVIPLIAATQNIASQIAIFPKELGLKTNVAVRCETILSISHKRLVSYFGTVTPETMAKVDQALRFLLSL